jgi:hypothetical protein
MNEIKLIQNVAEQTPPDEAVSPLDEQAIIRELAGDQLEKLAKLYFVDEKQPDKILHSYDNIDSKWRHAWFTRLVGNLSLMMAENFIRNPRLIETIQTIITIFKSTQFKTRLTSPDDIALANQAIKAVCEYFNFPLNAVTT